MRGNPGFVLFGTAPFFFIGLMGMDAGWKGMLFVTLPTWFFATFLWVLYFRARTRDALVAQLGFDPGNPKRGFGFGFLLGMALPIAAVIGASVMAKAGIPLPDALQMLLLMMMFGPFGVLLIVAAGLAGGFIWSMAAKTSSKEVRRLLAEKRAKAGPSGPSVYAKFTEELLARKKAEEQA